MRIFVSWRDRRTCPEHAGSKRASCSVQVLITEDAPDIRILHQISKPGIEETCVFYFVARIYFILFICCVSYINDKCFN